MSTRRQAALGLGLGLALALGLAGCGTKPRTPAAVVPAVPAPPPPVNQPDVIEIERQWLLSFFSGTPVEIRRDAGGALTITVPAQFCFHAGSAIIKPPLAKVLEKVGLSLRRRPQLGVPEVEAPADAGTGAAATLAQKRALAVQRRLRSFGIAKQRFGTATVSKATEVLLRLQAQPDPA